MKVIITSVSYLKISWDQEEFRFFILTINKMKKMFIFLKEFTTNSNKNALKVHYLINEVKKMVVNCTIRIDHNISSRSESFEGL